MGTKELMKRYEKKRKEIKRRLLQFGQVWKESDEKIFAELAFCFCTPQSNARTCDLAVMSMLKTGILFRGDAEMIKRHLIGNVRFHNSKSRYIVEARDIFSCRGDIVIKNKLMHNNPFRIREWLVQSVRGLGYKEASHFLRNIGMGENIAILDRHILKNLAKYSVIDEVPKTLTKNRYLEIEKKMKKFSEKLGIPFAELDLLFWSEETGEIFK